MRKLLSNVSHIIIEECSIYDHNEYSIVISDSKNAIITDSDNGIKIQGCTDITLEENFISPNYLHGYFLINSSFCDIINNRLFSNQYGIRTEYSNYNNIIGNNLEYHKNAIYLSHSNSNIIMNNNGADNINEIIEYNCQNNLFENNFPQQEINNTTANIDVTILIIYAISFFLLAYIIMNVYRDKKLSKSSYLKIKCVYDIYNTNNKNRREIK